MLRKDTSQNHLITSCLLSAKHFFVGEAQLFPIYGVVKLKFRTFTKDAHEGMGEEGEGDKQTPH